MKARGCPQNRYKWTRNAPSGLGRVVEGQPRTATLRLWPEEAKVTAADLRPGIDLRPPRPPLELSIKVKENPVPAGHTAVLVEIRNVSDAFVTICRHPYQFHYQGSGDGISIATSERRKTIS